MRFKNSTECRRHTSDIHTREVRNSPTAYDPDAIAIGIFLNPSARASSVLQFWGEGAHEPVASGVRNVLGLGGLETFVLNTANAVQKAMNAKHLPAIDSLNGSAVAALVRGELPLTVRDAAAYLGVSVQTVYLWVERKQIRHLRVMGRNIRFLKSDLEPFRATFKQEVGINKERPSDEVPRKSWTKA
jgi:excisionase family DNA binding protein